MYGRSASNAPGFVHTRLPAHRCDTPLRWGEIGERLLAPDSPPHGRSSIPDAPRQVRVHVSFGCDRLAEGFAHACPHVEFVFVTPPRCSQTMHDAPHKRGTGIKSVELT